MNRKPWRIVGSLWFAFCLAYVARQSIFSIFPVLRSHLGFTESQLGLTGTVFLWSYALANVIAGFAVDRLSAARLVVLSVMSWSLSTFLLGTATSVIGVLLCRALLALTQAFYIVSAIALISQWHGEQSRSKALSLHGTSQMVGVTIGGWYGGYATELLDWRWMLWLLSAVGMIYGLGLRFLISDADQAKRGAPVEIPGRMRVRLSRVILSFTYLAFCLVFFAICGMIWINYTWLADFLKSKFDLPLATAGWVATAYTQLATLPGLCAGAYWGDRLGRSSRKGRLWLVVAGLGLSSLFFYLLAAGGSLPMVKLAGLGYGLFQGVFNANFMAALVSLLPKYHRGVGVGLCNTVGSIAGGLCAYLMGHLKGTVTPESLFGLVAAVGVFSSLVLAVILLLFFDHDDKVFRELG